jgi:hypothetical protein
MALLMVDLVRRDFDYGKFCHEEFFTDEVAGYLRHGKEYQICIDFVRMMIQKHDKEQADGQEVPEKASDSGGDATAES